MTELDTADLAVIAGRILGIDADAALARMEIPAAQAALAQARQPGREPDAAFPDAAAAAAAAVALVHALLWNRPFSQRNQPVAVAAGLQFLSLNGWRADLNPAATTVVVIEALASGRLAPGDAAAWLSARLSQASRAHRVRRAPAAGPRSRPGRPLRRPPVPAPVARAAVSTLLAVTVGGVAVLAAACSRAPDISAAAAPSVRAVGAASVPAAASASVPAVAVRVPAAAATSVPAAVAVTVPVPAAATAPARQFPGAASVRSADLAYAACMRSHGLGDFPDPSADGVALITATAGIDPNSAQFRSAQRTCQAIAPAAVIRIVVAP